MVYFKNTVCSDIISFTLKEKTIHAVFVSCLFSQIYSKIVFHIQMLLFDLPNADRNWPRWVHCMTIIFKLQTDNSVPIDKYMIGGVGKEHKRMEHKHGKHNI